MTRFRTWVYVVTVGLLLLASAGACVGQEEAAQPAEGMEGTIVTWASSSPTRPCPLNRAVYRRMVSEKPFMRRKTISAMLVARLQWNRRKPRRPASWPV